MVRPGHLMIRCGPGNLPVTVTSQSGISRPAVPGMQRTRAENGGILTASNWCPHTRVTRRVFWQHASRRSLNSSGGHIQAPSASSGSCNCDCGTRRFATHVRIFAPSIRHTHTERQTDTHRHIHTHTHTHRHTHTHTDTHTDTDTHKIAGDYWAIKMHRITSAQRAHTSTLVRRSISN
jgi:hypothetical protein